MSMNNTLLSQHKVAQQPWLQHKFLLFMISMLCWYPHGLGFVLPLHLHSNIQIVGCSQSQFVTLEKNSLKSLRMTFPCPVC